MESVIKFVVLKITRYVSDETMICPECKGEGKIIGLFPRWADDVPKKDRKPYIELECPRCKGKKEVPIEMATWMKEGEIIRNRRIRAKLTLRKACKLLDMDAVVLSEMERGVIKPDLDIYYESKGEENVI